MTRRSNDTQTILRHWREAVPNDRLAHLVKDATRALIRALSTRLADHKVSFGHWAFLRILWEHDGLTQRELSEQAGVMEPTTFAAVKTMERLGYVVRRKASGDQKRSYVYLTPRGRVLKSRLVPLAEDVNQIAIRGCQTGRCKHGPAGAARNHQQPRKRRDRSRPPDAVNTRAGGFEDEKGAVLSRCLSLLCIGSIPVSRRKFPVLFRWWQTSGEPKSPVTCRLSPSLVGGPSPGSGLFAVIFPVCREYAQETGSKVTASTSS